MSDDQLIVSSSEPRFIDHTKSSGDLTASIQEFFQSSIFSDLTIVTKEQEYKVHRLIICGQSGYFSHLFKREWSETRESTIKLVEDDPTAIEAMIHFMYGFNYDSSGSERNRASPMLFNIKVYQIGDKYDIPKLKEQAREKFITVIEKCWEMDDFPIAITSAYMTTVSTDRGLRDPLIGLVLSHIDVLLRNEDFKQVLKEVTCFAADLVQGQKNRVELKTYCCPSCSKEWTMEKVQSIRYCPLCSYSYQRWSDCIVKK